MSVLTAHEQQLRDRARTFATDRVLPLAAELDPAGEPIPRDFLHEVAAAGWFGVTVPEEHGGMGWGCSGTASWSRSCPEPG